MCVWVGRWVGGWVGVHVEKHMRYSVLEILVSVSQLQYLLVDDNAIRAMQCYAF